MAWTGNVLFPFVQSVRVLGIRKRSGPPRILPDEELSHRSARRNTGHIREQIDRLGGAGNFFGVEERSEESRVHHHANAVEKRVGDGNGARADGSLRSTVGTAQRAPSATRGGRH